MYEKDNVQIFRWADHNIPWDDKLRQKLVENLVGKPIVIYVAGVRQKIGVVRQTRLGRDGIFGDLVLETEETAVPSFDELAKLNGFTEVKINFGEGSPNPLSQEFTVLQEKLKASEDQREALEDAMRRMSEEMAEEANEKLENQPFSRPDSPITAGEDLAPGEFIIIKDGKAWPAIPHPHPELKPEEKPKQRSRKKKEI